MSTSESHSWFTDLWNYSIVPYLLEAVRDGVQVTWPLDHTQTTLQSCKDDTCTSAR